MSQRSSWGSNRPASRKGYRVLRYWADAHDGTGYRRHCETVRGTKRDGDRRLAELRVAHADDRPVMTVGEVYRRYYLPDIEGRLAEQSLSVYRSAWETHISPRWSGTHLSDVRPLDFQEWLLTLSKGTADTVMKVMKGLFRIADRYEMVERNPMLKQYRMPTRVEKRDGDIYTLAELIVMWRQMQGSPILVPFVLAAFGSARVGESLAALGDEVRAVELDGLTYAIVPIRREMLNRTRRVEERAKNDQSFREIAVPPPMSSVLLGRTGWLSDRGTGDPTTQQQLNAAWTRECRRMGVERHLFKNLRTSWRTWMASSDISFEMLEKMMGHVGTTVTDRYYLKPTGEQFAAELHRAITGKLASEWVELR